MLINDRAVIPGSLHGEPECQGRRPGSLHSEKGSAGAAGMSLAGEEEKETCTGKRLRSHDSTTAWGSSSSDAADTAGETERTLTKHARRRPAGAQAAEMEPAQKKRQGGEAQGGRAGEVSEAKARGRSRSCEPA